MVALFAIVGIIYLISSFFSIFLYKQSCQFSHLSHLRLTQVDLVSWTLLKDLNFLFQFLFKVCNNYLPGKILLSCASFLLDLPSSIEFMISSVKERNACFLNWNLNKVMVTRTMIKTFVKSQNQNCKTFGLCLSVFKQTTM